MVPKKLFRDWRMKLMWENIAKISPLAQGYNIQSAFYPLRSFTHICILYIKHLPSSLIKTCGNSGRDDARMRV